MKAAVVVLSSMLLLACGDFFSPPAGLSFAAASNSCWGMGGASAIELAAEPIRQGESPSYPYVLVTMRVQPFMLGPGTWLAPSDTAIAYYVTGPNQQETGSGRLTVRRTTKSGPVLGSVDLEFGSRHITGDFFAGWVARP